MLNLSSCLSFSKREREEWTYLTVGGSLGDGGGLSVVGLNRGLSRLTVGHSGRSGLALGRTSSGPWSGSGSIFFVMLSVLLVTGCRSRLRSRRDGVTSDESFRIVTVSVQDGVVGATLFELLVQVVVDEVVLLRRAADVLVSGHTVQMDLVENCAFSAHERVLGSSNAVVESLAFNRWVSIVSVLLAVALEGGSLQKQLEEGRLRFLFLLLFLRSLRDGLTGRSSLTGSGSASGLGLSLLLVVILIVLLSLLIL